MHHQSGETHQHKRASSLLHPDLIPPSSALCLSRPEAFWEFTEHTGGCVCVCVSEGGPFTEVITACPSKTRSSRTSGWQLPVVEAGSSRLVLVDVLMSRLPLTAAFINNYSSFYQVKCPMKTTNRCFSVKTTFILGFGLLLGRSRSSF